MDEWFHSQYKLQCESSQHKMKDMCSAYVDRYLQGVIPENIWEERVYVNLDRNIEGLEKIILEGTNFTMTFKTKFQGQSRAVITCFFEQNGKTEQYVTVIRANNSGEISFCELGLKKKEECLKRQEKKNSEIPNKLYLSRRKLNTRYVQVTAREQEYNYSNFMESGQLDIYRNDKSYNIYLSKKIYHEERYYYKQAS